MCTGAAAEISGPAGFALLFGIDGSFSVTAAGNLIDTFFQVADDIFRHTHKSMAGVDIAIRTDCNTAVSGVAGTNLQLLKVQTVQFFRENIVKLLFVIDDRLDEILREDLVLLQHALGVVAADEQGRVFGRIYHRGHRVGKA